MPIYPTVLLKEGISGQVIVRFAVETNGSISNPTVVGRAHPEFEKAAIRAILDWKYEPGRRKGKKIRFWMTQKFDFTLGG